MLNGLFENAEEIIICVAFLKLSGLKSIIEKLNSKLGYCTFFIGTDFYLTEPDALLLLHKQGHLVYITKQEKITFHPKLYYFKSIDSIQLITGSANITSGGLESNFEVSSLLEFIKDSDIDKDFNHLINNFKTNSRQVSERIIENYRINYTKYRTRHSQADKDFEAEKIVEQDDDDNQNVSIYNENEGVNKPKGNKNPTRFTDNDRARFPLHLEQFIEYKKNIRPSGVVSQKDKDIYPELYRWYNKIKEIISNGLLPFDIEKILRAEGFPIEDGKLANSRIDWNNNFEKLVQYKIDNNLDIYNDEFRIPQRKDPDHIDYFLGGWCARQKLRRNGKYSPEWDIVYEENKMESIRYIWDVPVLGGSEFEDEEWFEKLKLLENYYKHNPTTIRKSIPDPKTQVGHWLSDQMTLKNAGRRNKSGELIRLHPIREGYLNIILEENGIEWQWEKQKHREFFEEKLKELLELQNGDRSKVPPQGKDDVTKLGEWFAQVKSALKPETKRKLAKWKIERLKAEGLID